MEDKVSVKPIVIEGFDAYKAGKDLYKRAEEVVAELFGRDSRAYKAIMDGIDANNARGSQFFFNTLMGLVLPKGQRVALYDDLGRINDSRPRFFKGIYTDTPQIVLRSAIPSWKPNTKILENLVGQVKKRGLEFSPENPLVISGVELARDGFDDNSYGILITLGDKATFRNDTRFAYGNDSIPFGKESRTLWTKKDDLL